MKTLEITGLKNVQKVAKGLQQLLADLQVHYTNLRGFHWNIKGKEFYFLHEKFEEMYDDTAAKVDEVAERLLMIGETPVHTFSEYLKVSSIRETGVVSDGDEAVKIILETYKHLIASERAILSEAAELGDEATVALLSDYISGQEKEVWMLTSYLSNV
ncbi:MAG: DNA starvation/stationary phase protection protein [Porphyromonadaceae bacterium]|nr:DNA starvation/stationary phase protection protein [Porphyromonadaceae bacterium]